MIMKTKCKKCGSVIYVEKGEEHICDDCYDEFYDALNYSVITQSVEEISQSVKKNGMQKEYAWRLRNPCDSCVYNDANAIAVMPCEICMYVCYPCICHEFENYYEYREGAALVWD